MKSANRVCERCGAKIPDDATREVCPACLLETGLGVLDDEFVAGVDGGSASPKTMNAFEERVPPPRTPQPAGILADFGDYELLEEIGRGGQGVVYRAHQKSLNRTAALKVIGLGPWTTEAYLKRFRREAEAAASLDHPYIVPIYEVGEREGSCYFSMKFVEGGQLDAVVRRSPISIRKAAELIAKIARTVHYAHEHGILHRDIKPGNILLDRNGEPHLTDFGLARLVEAESTVTGTLDVLGTPSYMAPEQAKGTQGAAVSSPPNASKLARTIDVYGLGAVLYQLITGQPPFAGGTTYETIKLLLDTEPRQPRQLNPKIDRDLSTICLKCLEKDPQRRYSSALALAEDLEHWLKHEPIRAKPSGFFTHAQKWVRRNPSTTVLVTLLVAVLAGLGITVWNHQPAVLIPKSIAVLPFENLTDDPNNAYFAEGIHEEILTRLASIAGLTVISRTSTQQYQSKPRNLREIASQLGVANILEGSVQKAADQVRVNVQLIHAQTDSHLWAETYDRKLTDVFGVESEIAKGIAESLQAKLTVREEQALTVKTTNNSEAYDAYLRGLSLDARSEPSLEAAGFYECAVQIDPNFASAWARLSRAQAFLHSHLADTTPPTRRDAAKTALENAQRLEPNSPETLLALGYYQASVLDDYELAKTTFKKVSKLLPGNSEIPAALGHLTQTGGHVDESIAYFEQGLALDPRNISLLVGAAATYAMLRQFPVAIKLYDRALDVIPNDPELTGAKASMYQAEGDLQESAKLLAQTPSGTAWSFKLSQLRLERNHAEAIRLLQARLAQVPSTFGWLEGVDLLKLAFAQGLVGDSVGAKLTAERARDTLEPLCREQPSNPAIHVDPLALSLANAMLGERDSAVREEERAKMTLDPISKTGDRLAHEELLAFVETILGENSRAVSTLTQLLKTPYASFIYGPVPVTPALLRLDPIWDPLRGDPAFQKLCEEKQP
jgi:TolB-like protein